MAGGSASPTNDSAQPNQCLLGALLWATYPTSPALVPNVITSIIADA